jgi:hypothetical protein
VSEHIRRHGPVLGLAGLALTACALKPPVPEVIERERSYEVGREIAQQRVGAALQAAGFPPSDPADGQIRASLTYEDERGWARCRAPLIKEMGGDRRRPARPLDRTANVTARIEGDDNASQVIVDANFEARMLNGFTNRELDVACRSLGSLEAQVLDAVGRP